MSFTSSARSAVRQVYLAGVIASITAYIGLALLLHAGDEPAQPAQHPWGPLGQKIVDEAGLPVAGARIGLWRQAPKYHFVSEGRPATSDARGDFQLSRLRDAHYRLVVEKDGFARTYRGESVEDRRQPPADCFMETISPVKWIRPAEGRSS